jgi:hypothetical protein
MIHRLAVPHGRHNTCLEKNASTMAKGAYNRFSKEEQKTLATWAVACAERVLPFFKQERPQDERPRKALEVCRTWVQTGIFKMAEIRGASLAAHAAAREVTENSPAFFAARAAGQAVATAHVAQHAYGGAYYALKAIAAADPDHAETRVAEEREWQSQQLPTELRDEIMARLIVQKKGRKLQIRIDKSGDF